MDTLRNSFGLEEVARESLVILFNQLNDELVVEQTYWNPYDEELDTLRGKEYIPVIIEPIEPNNFHLGHQPSLIEDDTPKESYPSVSVMSYRTQANEDDQNLDHESGYNDNLYVEILVKASPEEGEEVCNKRAWRTANSVNKVIQRNRHLNGAVSEVSTPTCVISENFTRKENSDYGDEGHEYLWQAARIDYVLDKISPFDY